MAGWKNPSGPSLFLGITLAHRHTGTDWAFPGAVRLSPSPAQLSCQLPAVHHHHEPTRQRPPPVHNERTPQAFVESPACARKPSPISFPSLGLAPPPYPTTRVRPLTQIQMIQTVGFQCGTQKVTKAERVVLTYLRACKSTAARLLGSGIRTRQYGLTEKADVTCRHRIRRTTLEKVKFEIRFFVFLVLYFSVPPPDFLRLLLVLVLTTAETGCTGIRTQWRLLAYYNVNRH